MADISRQALVVGELTLASNGSRIYQCATRDKNECDAENVDFQAPHFKDRKTVEVFALQKLLTPVLFGKIRHLARLGRYRTEQITN